MAEAVQEEGSSMGEGSPPLYMGITAFRAPGRPSRPPTGHQRQFKGPGDQEAAEGQPNEGLRQRLYFHLRQGFAMRLSQLLAMVRHPMIL